MFEDLAWSTIAIVAAMASCVVAYAKYRSTQRRAYHAQLRDRGLKYVKLSNSVENSIFTTRRVELAEAEAVKREGPIFAFTLMNQCTIMMADLEIAQTVLHKEFTDFVSRRKFDGLNKLLSENVALVTNGEQWKRLRAISSPAFSVGKLKTMKTGIDDTIRTMTANLRSQIDRKSTTETENDCGINVKTIFDAFTIDTIMRIAFGVKVDSLNDPNNPVIVNGRDFVAGPSSTFGMLKLFVTFYAPTIARLFGVEFQKKQIDFFAKLSMEIIEQKRAKFSESSRDGGTKASSFIELMLEAEAEYKRLEKREERESGGIANGEAKSSKYLTNDEIISQCIMFLLAGFDTTSTALTLAAYYLALNPDKQQTLYEEIESILSRTVQKPESHTDSFDSVTYESVPQFRYLSAVIDEVLRLDSPAIFLERAASKDMTLCNSDQSIRFEVRRDDVIHIPVYAIHHDEKYFPEPESFRPERFIDSIDSAAGPMHKLAYMPFGSGPRNCIARGMALLEAKLALLHLVRQFKFDVCAKTEIPLKFKNLFDFHTPCECWLRVTARN